MRSRKTAVAASLLTSGTIIASAIMLVLGEPEIPVPRPIADVWRAIVILMIAYALGMMLLMIWRTMRVRIDPHDQLTVPSFMVLLGLFCSEIFIAFYLLKRTGKPSIGWSTPLGFVTMLLIDVGTTNLTCRMGRMVQKAGNRAAVKLTMTDTSKPGADIDLSPKSHGEGVSECP